MDYFNGDNDYLLGVPKEILIFLLKFLDVPTVGALIQTSSPSYGNIAELAAMDHTWLQIVNQRFNIFKAKRVAKGNVSKPRLYGGPTWKDAYRNMAISNRMPKLQVQYKKRNVFAKGCGYKIETEGKSIKTNTLTSNPSQSKKIRQGRQGHLRNQFVACWVMISHTENCNLRTTTLDIQYPRCHDRALGRSDLNGSWDRVGQNSYVELQIALQNTKSGFCSVDIDVCKATVQMYDSSDSFYTQRIIRHGPLRPKVVYRSVGVDVDSYMGQRYLDGHLGDVITLRPFEFVMVSVCVPLTHYTERNEQIQFETDFLSRALSICVPVTCQMNASCETPSSGDMHQNSAYSSIAIAKFASEHEIWENYMELPGGCLTLVDKRD